MPSFLAEPQIKDVRIETGHGDEGQDLAAVHVEDGDRTALAFESPVDHALKVGIDR